MVLYSHAKFSRRVPKFTFHDCVLFNVLSALDLIESNQKMMKLRFILTQEASRVLSLSRTAVTDWTHRAFPGTPPASGSGSPRRTWPLRKPAAPEAATWAASWLWVAPSNHPDRDIGQSMFRLGDTGNAHGYKAAECACMALSSSVYWCGSQPLFKLFP